ncbi:hypothetical protein FACS1894219_04690 [Clostridia bacterium]|nr:hypothetical protein FACS1894219_04690 [Clostridia bacterium]
MNIAWKYIDKTVATIAAIRDYSSMRANINNTPDAIKELYQSMSTPRNSVPTGMPSVHNPQAGESILATQIDKLDILRERYSTAVEYMAWFEPAWGMLTDTEQHILREFYMCGSQRSGATHRLMAQLEYSESHTERLRSLTLKRLQTLLLG